MCVRWGYSTPVTTRETGICNTTFCSWTAKNNQRRSITLQFDKAIRNDINLNHTSLDSIQKPCFPVKPLPSAKIISDLLEPCTKKEFNDTIKRNDMDTIISLMKPCLVTAYIDGSSDSECNMGSSGFFLKKPDNTTSKHKVSAEQIVSSLTCELMAIRTALDIYLTQAHIANSNGFIML
ncbi:RNase H domain-containing protein [Trichonephila clavipes]|nr:RNase H domain-containing protein [Trichonephila clavipes]